MKSFDHLLRLKLYSRILPELWVLIRIEFDVISGVDIASRVAHPDICVRYL